MSLSNTILKVVLPSGHRAVYEVQPQHINLQHWGATLNQSAIEHGTQLAHQHGKSWYKRGGWDEITDPKTLKLLEAAPEAAS